MARGDISSGGGSQGPTWHYPFTGYNFDVAVDGGYYSFKEVSGLEVQVQVKSKTEDHIIMSVPTGERKFSNVTLKRGLLPNGSFFADWASRVEESPMNGALEVKDVTIFMMDDKGSDIMMWVLKKAYPIKYTVGPLNSTENSIAVESIELAYKQFEQVAIL